MKIGGLQKVSLIDYPGLISAVIFTQGCNFRCSYCHNPELVDPQLFAPCICDSEVLEFMKTRRGKLDAVSITGGEPTIQDDLMAFIKKIKKMGFAVKLDTNGSQPQVIKTLLEEELLNYIAMDIKGPLEKYETIACVPVDGEKIMASLKIILQARIPHEFRTTVIKSQLTENDFQELAILISGAKKYFLQKFVPIKTLDNKFFQEKTYSDEEWKEIKKHFEKEIPSVIVR
jgi:pyruvate formate lyase activating enzyme